MWILIELHTSLGLHIAETTDDRGRRLEKLKKETARGNVKKNRSFKCYINEHVYIMRSCGNLHKVIYVLFIRNETKIVLITEIFAVDTSLISGYLTVGCVPYT